MRLIIQAQAPAVDEDTPGEQVQLISEFDHGDVEKEIAELKLQVPEGMEIISTVVLA